MSLEVDAVSSSENMDICKSKQDGDDLGEKSEVEESGDEGGEKVHRRTQSERSCYATEDEDEDDEHHNKIQVGPQFTLKEQFEKDKVFLFLFPYFAHSLLHL